MTIPPDGSFAGLHWACVTRPLQGDMHSIVIRLTQWWDYTYQGSASRAVKVGRLRYDLRKYKAL